MATVNFWDLGYVWYIIGFLLVPRITAILIFNNYVTQGFEWYNILVGLTIFWMYPALALGVGSKILFSFLFAFFPRLLLGIIGYNYLPDNHSLMIIACVSGAVIDVAAKFLRQAFSNS